MKTNDDKINLLDLMPIKAVAAEINENQRMVLLRPKFTNKLLVKYLLPHLKRPNFRVTLDEFGTAVWNYIDGKRTVAEIADCLKIDFGATIEPVYERLGKYFRTLNDGGFIDYQEMKIK
jgi:hypothetical protein